MNRRSFLQSTAALAAGALVLSRQEMLGALNGGPKLKVALVGTGVRGINFWGRNLVENYSDVIEFVGLCDSNPGRLAYARNYIGVNCPTFTDFDTMLQQVTMDRLMVCTVDSNHHAFIVKALNRGVEVITEKPLTTDETKCQQILDAERSSGKQIRVGFNYRYNPHYTKVKELIVNDRVGRITSVDFNWYLNVYHGASYYRRWHGLRDQGGTLLVHKSTHHFDLLNWWLDSDPVEVFAYGALEHYGHNGPYRGSSCRSCKHKQECKYFWDITSSPDLMALYTDHEQHDGYIRDNCVYREEIDIFDKMSVQVVYANHVVVNYSLTTYSPYEGMRIAFNGEKGRIDAWDGIPWARDNQQSQAELHATEMSQDYEEPKDFEEIYVMDNFGGYRQIRVPRERGGHGGGDKRLQNRLLRDSTDPDPLHHAAGSRDGALSILVGIAARKSIDEGRRVRIEELTDLKLHARRPV
jgi:predicted dehydrogenase